MKPIKLKVKFLKCNKCKTIKDCKNKIHKTEREVG